MPRLAGFGCYASRVLFYPMISALKKALKRSPWLTTTYRNYRDSRYASLPPKRTPSGFMFCGPRAMQDGTFEAAEGRCFVDLVRGVDTLVNVGANCGYYACWARNLGKRVIAVEPHPFNYATILRNLAVNQWSDVEVYPVALSDNPGVLKLFGSGTGASLTPGWANSSTRRFEYVPALTLDRVAGDSLDGRQVLYWIDVEGAELSVLCGAKRQLERSPAGVWVVEITIGDLQPGGARVNRNLWATFELFWSAGYQGRHLLTGIPVAETQVRQWCDGVNVVGGDNFVFTKS